MRAAGVTLLSMTLTAAVIGNAFYQKKQFYPSVVYITKSNPCMAVIYVQAFVLVILTGKLMRKVFFGQLRAAEFEHLMERSWYAVTETCLAFTVFRDDFSPKFVALFTVLLFLKSFHWLAEDRVDFMERSPVISWIFHIRVLSLLMVLGALDLHFVGHAYQSTVTKGASVQLVFGFEYAILLTIILNIGIKYVLHTLDLQSDNPWENKAVFLLYTELAMGFIKVILYITFVAIMVRIYTLPLFAFRPMYYTMRAFNKAFNDVVLSRRAIRNMNTLYPDATPEELSAADNVCIICREEMVTASKKLPCNHIFHTSCLRSWFQRQQTCPTCRLNILQVPQPNPAAQQGAMGGAMAGAAQQPPVQPPAGGPAMNPFMPMMAGGFPGGMPPFWQPFQVPAQPPQAAAAPQQPPATTPGQAVPSTSADTAATPGTSATPGTQAGTSTATAANGSQPAPQMVPPTSATIPPFLYPPFPMIPFMVPPPLPPRDWSGLSDEELRALEGTTREAVEARLRVLHQVLLLLDAAAVMANQCATATPHPQNPAFSARLPTAASSGASTSSAGGSSSTEPTVVTTSTTETVKTTTQLPSETTSKAGPSVETASSSESIDTNKAAESGEQNLGSSLEQEEIRRRRLQKFSTETSSMREGSMPPAQE